MLIPESLEPSASPRDASARTPTTASLESLRQSLPEEATDLKLNLQSVLADGSLSPSRRFGVAIAVALASSDPALARALEAEADKHLDDATLAAIREDARTAAAIMSMNNVYYRFRHLVGKPSYSQIPARLRMNRLSKPKTSKADLELFSLAVSAVNGCESCVQSHESVVTAHGLTEQEVHDAIRIAATVHAVSVIRSW
ncbi:MAG: carboxymuconolactone decarboxylase family protein [Sandaracinaceae bacterium]|nr:carboxymuconolactone decarboxylase family protein [Sandaracinaceae bacterium]